MQHGKNYVVSLTSAHDRRKHIESEFGKQHIPFEFFDAVTPDLIEIKAKEFGIDITGTSLMKGELACALSHIALWHLVKKEKLDYLCIFEDDIYLGENAATLLKPDYLPPDTHILKLETLPNTRINRFVQTEKTVLNRQLFRLKQAHFGTGGYIITHSGADFLLKKLTRLENAPIDNLMFDQYLQLDDYNVLQISPAVCVQDFILHPKNNFKSTLDDERKLRWENEKSGKKQETLLAKLKRKITKPFKKINRKLFTRYIKFK